MASWLQNQLRAAEGLLEAVDRTAKHVSVTHKDDGDDAFDNGEGCYLIFPP